MKRTAKERRLWRKKAKIPKKKPIREIDKKEEVNLMTEKTGNRTNITGGANKFQRRHRNKRSNSEDTGY